MPDRSEVPLAAPRRYYPGFFAALFLVLLRIAIGWHFLYEGMEKIEGEGDKAFSAEVYLRNSAGPMAPYFRGMVPDVNGLEQLDPVRLEARWTAEVERIAAHFGFDETQRQKALERLKNALASANDWFRDPETVGKVRKYKSDLLKNRTAEKNSKAMSFERERVYAAWPDLNAQRLELLKPISAWAGALRGDVIKIATPEQAERADTYRTAWTQLDWANWMTKYGLAAIGLCLIAGFLTPLAALGAAGYLAMFYLSQPPWPGLPRSPMTEGHYWIVNKNLIELLACLVLASTPNGLWVGLDALLFGRSRRRRDAEAEADAESAAYSLARR